VRRRSCKSERKRKWRKKKTQRAQRARGATEGAHCAVKRTTAGAAPGHGNSGELRERRSGEGWRKTMEAPTL